MREEFINSLLMILQESGVDLDDVKSKIYILARDYKIEKASMELVQYDVTGNMELLKRFLVSKAVEGCTKRTTKYYADEIRKFLEETNKPVSEIKADDIRYNLVLHEARDKWSKVTCDNRLRCIKSFFSWLSMEGLITGNESLKVSKIRQKKKTKKAFDEIDIEKMRGVIKDERDLAIFEILSSTGCRVSELAQMKVDEWTGDRILVHGKGEKDRIVYLNAKAIVALEKYMSLRTDNSEYISPGCLPLVEAKALHPETGYRQSFWKIKELVREDAHINTGTVEAKIRKLGKMVGVDKAHPHRFRRTCATMALRRGMPIELVSKMLGHEQISTTQTYLDLDEKSLEESHKKYVV